MASSSSSTSDPVVIDENYNDQILRATQSLTGALCRQGLLRLAWKDAGTYNAETMTGGANGSIRDCEVLKAYENSELAEALKRIEAVKVNNPKLTYADIIQLAGKVAVEASGGPTIKIVPGRKDSLLCPDKLQFPDATPGFDLKTFHRMGLSNDRDIVALIGGLTLGRAFRVSLQHEDTGSLPPMKFDNSYFVELMHGKAVASDQKALLAEPKFQQYIQLYLQNQNAFFEDYAAAHKKFSELGFKPSSLDHNIEGEIIATLARECNKKISLQKDRTKKSLYTLKFGKTKYEVTVAREPSQVDEWLSVNVKASMKPNRVGLSGIWSSDGTDLYAIQICLWHQVLVYHICPSDNIPISLRCFLEDEELQKFTVTRWEKDRFKGKLAIKQLRSVGIPKAQLGLELAGNWKTGGKLSKDQITVSALRVILAYEELGKK